MSIRTAVSVLALTAATIAPLSSQAASIFGHADRQDPTVSATAVKGKTVKLTLKNRTADAMTLMINDVPVTLAANSETTVRAAVNSNIYAEDHTTVKLHVTGDLAGNTVSFR